MSVKHLLLGLIVVSVNLHAQPKTSTTKTKAFYNYDDLRVLQQADSVSTLYYADSLLNYKLSVPSWLALKETNSRGVWGGTLPLIKLSPSVIMIKAFQKKDYPTIKDFENYIIGDWVFGTHPKWSAQHTCTGQKNTDPYQGIGNSWRVFVFYGGKIYACKYVLAETKTAFLWIDFTSASPNYDADLPRFEEFMKSFAVLN